MGKRGEVAKSPHALKMESLRRARYLLGKGHLAEREVYELVKFFFQEYLHKHYEFTVDELREELEKVYLTNQARARVEAFLSAVEAMEYDQKIATTDELKTLLRRFEDVADLLIVAEQRRESFLSRLLRLGRGSKRSNLDTRLGQSNTLGEGLAQLRRHVEQEDKEAAIKAYKEVMGLYERASMQEKQSIYPELAQAYEQVRKLL